jgi:hypothetical protein
MRTLKRLFPVLALILLTGVVLAMPTGLTRASSNPAGDVLRPKLYSGFNNPPAPRIYFGTVVRDTADEQNVGPDRGVIPSIRQAEAPRGLAVWIPFFVRCWDCLLLAPK